MISIPQKTVLIDSSSALADPTHLPSIFDACVPVPFSIQLQSFIKPFFSLAHAFVVRGLYSIPINLFGLLPSEVIFFECNLDVILHLGVAVVCGLGPLYISVTSLKLRLMIIFVNVSALRA